MTTGENDMNSNQISRLRVAVWRAAKAIMEVCNVLEQIEGETRYFESLQYQTMSTSTESREGTDNV